MAKGHILVTGGAGYIGSHVCYALRQQGYTPVTLDNLTRGHREAVRFGPLVEGDCGNRALVQEMCARYQPLAAMHFAALIEVSESVKFPDLFMTNNWDKARTLFQTLQINGVTKVVFSSTAAVYGIPDQNILLTEDCPLRPINPYGQSKLEAEQFLRAQPQMSAIALRYFNASGAETEAGLGEAHWPESHLIPNAILAGIGKKPEGLTIFGQDYATPDGTAVRDYIHVSDLAAAHVQALDYLLQGGASEVINLGCGNGYSVKQVIEMSERIIGKPVPATYGARRAGDPALLVAGNSKAQAVLGWKPQRGLEVIVRSAYTWHQSAAYDSLIEAKRRP